MKTQTASPHQRTQPRDLRVSSHCVLSASNQWTLWKLGAFLHGLFCFHVEKNQSEAFKPATSNEQLSKEERRIICQHPVRSKRVNLCGLFML